MKIRVFPLFWGILDVIFRVHNICSVVVIMTPVSQTMGFEVLTAVTTKKISSGV
jgi:hypothetical protein